MRALGQIVERLKRTLVRRGVHANDAEDIVQESFARLEETRGRQVVEAPEGFLVRTALNLSIDAARRRKRWNFVAAPVEDLGLVDAAPLPDEALAAHRRLSKLRAGIDALDPELRSAVILKKLEKMTIREIAEHEQVSTSTVERRLKAGLAALLEWMGEE